MFAPSEELVKRYAETIVTETDPRHRATQELIRDYVLKNFTGEKNGQRPRVLLLVFRGPDAVEKIHQHRRPHRARAHQRRNDSRYLWRLHHGWFRQGDLFRARRARGVRPRSRRARFEALGGIFRSRRRHSRSRDRVSRRTRKSKKHWS